MRKISNPYTVSSAHSFDLGRHHVVQNYGMRLIASCHTFLGTNAGEHMRRNFIGSIPDPYHLAKAPGYRVYLRLEGSFRSIFPDEEEQRKEEIHAILHEMAQYYVETGLSEGQRRQFADRDVKYTPLPPREEETTKE